MEWVTIEDLETLFPAIIDEPENRVQLVVDSVEAYIKSRLEDNGVDYSDPQEPFRTNLRTVTIWVTGRALEPSGSMFGATEWSQTAGPVSQTRKYENGMGNLYLTGQELNMLGISAQGMGTQLFYSEDILGGGGDA